MHVAQVITTLMGGKLSRGLIPPQPTVQQRRLSSQLSSTRPQPLVSSQYGGETMVKSSD